MVAITEQPIWVNEIRQIEPTDPVQGGEGGIDNIPHQQLANRTAYLKQQLDELTIPSDLSGDFERLQQELDEEIRLREEDDAKLSQKVDKIKIPNLNNTLISDATDEALTAAQGKELKRLIDEKPATGEFTQNFSINGHTKLPNGLILQWGTHTETTNPSESSLVINFPVAFPNACLNWTGTRITSNPSGEDADGAVLLGSFTKQQFIVSLQRFNTESSFELRGFTWFAIGY